MRVVLDTNVFLSALISSHGAPDIIYHAWRETRFDLVTSITQLDELRRVSRYPKLKSILPPHRVGAMINNMQRAIVLETLPPMPQGIVIDDPDDTFLFMMAIAGNADYLVTGDRRAGLLELGNAGRAVIVTPAIFCTDVL